MNTRLIEKRFGRLLVIGFGERIVKPSGRIRNYWTCRCDCGVVKTVVEDSLMAGHSSSCGCLAIETRAANRTTHGLSGTPTHKIWLGIRKRCYQENSEAFYKYGGRGIKMCERWRNSFENFLADMGERPAGLTIERIDNNGDYEPGNCRWITSFDQASNRRTTVRVFDGESLAQCARRVGVDYKSLHKWNRMRGFPIEEAIKWAAKRTQPHLP